LVGRFLYETYAGLPKSKAKKQRLTPEEIAAKHGLLPEEVGPIDGERFLRFVWRVSGRPAIYAEDWKRERPLVIVLDNYSVHTGQPVQEAIKALEAANVFLFYLPAYCPQLSDIEPIWNAVKHHEILARSYQEVKDLKGAVEEVLDNKAKALLANPLETKNELRPAA
jgi:hypothetical protein